MAKQLNVSLNFAANTSQVKSELKSLQQDLYQIINMSGGKIGLTSELKEAKNAAKELSYHLNQAYNSSTGNIDLSKLNDSLQKSSTNVTQLSNKLLQAGSSGQSAFINLAKAISQADYPMFKLNSRLAEMWTTLKNTARWQLSSSILHGFMGAIQQASSYAKNLDESLNNIRIVTNMTAEEMDLFAEKANKAAKALNTTTTAYTNAALIFYQQGLESEEVEERTNTVIKMANVTGDSATDVSSYMTAIWNNFDDGSESLEHYADVITALGANTASSSSEIAAGLEKFASVAETIGLSYDYSTAALATIVANTRQSADTVGTGLRTIFSRLQGLSLGETLEDGVDLNKYSKALKTVGVDILDASGKMKNMDTILTDLAGKWDSLSKAQQTALAQTVGGVRQYTNLIALMDNWDDMEENLKTAGNAEGSLQDQADIYATSWEGARDRVNAAAEGIYNSLINRDLLKDFNLILADILTGVENLTNGFGGLKGVLSAVGSFALSLISHKIQPAIQGLVNNIKNLFVSTQVQARQLVQEFQIKNNEQINSGNYDTEQVQILKNTNVLSEARARLTVSSKQLTNQEMQLYQQDIQLIETSAKKAEVIAASVTALQNQTEQMINDINVTESNSEANRVYNEMLKERIALTEDYYSKAMQGKGDSRDQDFDNYIESEQAMNRLIDTKEQLDMVTNDLIGSIMNEMYACRGSESAMAALGEDVSLLREKTLDVSGTFVNFVNNLKIPQGATESVDSYRASVELVYKSMPKVIKQSTKVKRALQKVYDASDAKAFNIALAEMQKAIKGVKIGGQDLNKIVKELNPKSYKEFEAILRRLSKEENNLAKAQKELNNALAGFNPQHFVTGTERIVAMASAMGQVAMMGQSISSMISAWSNEDLTFGEQLTTTFMSLSMLIPGVISSFNSLKTMISGTALATALQDAALKKMGLTQDEITAKHLLYNAAKKGEVATDAAQAASKTLLTGLLRTEGITIDKNTASLIQNKIAEEMANGASLEAAITTALSTKLTGLDAAITDKDTAAKIANKIAADALGTSLKAMLGPIGLVIAALTALVTILTIVAKKQEEAAKTAKEKRLAEAEASQKAADEIKKLNDANVELYKTYNDLRMRNDESTTAKEQLKTATDELCKALGVEWDALDRLQGKYEDVNTAILEKRKEQIQETIDTYDRAIADNKDIVEDKVDKAIDEYDFGHSTGINLDGTKYDRIYASPDHGISPGGLGDSADDLVKSVFISYLRENYGNKLYSLNDETGQMTFNEDVDEAEILNILTDTFRYMRDNAEDLGITKDIKDDSEFYQWFRQLYNDSNISSLLAQIAEDESAREDAIAQMAEINAELAQAQAETGMSISEITNTEDYEAYKNQYITELRSLLETSGADMSKYTDDVLSDMADNYLSTYTNIAGIIENANIKDAVKERLMNSGQDSESEIDAFLAQAEEDGTLQVIAQVVTDGSTIDSLQQSMDYIQAKANEQTITAAVEVASGALKENGMTQDDWNTIQNSGIDWGNEEQGIIEFNQFMAMTYQAQVEYLDNLANAAREKFNNSLSDQMANVDTELTALEAKQAQLSEQISMATSGTAAGFHMIDNGFDVEAAKAELAQVEAEMASLNAQKETLNTEIQFAVTGQEDLADLNHILTDLVINGENGAETISNLEEVINKTGSAMAKAEGFDAEEFETYRDLLEDTYPVLEDNAMGLNMIAVANMRLNKGVKTLCSNWEDFNSIMIDSEASAEDLAEIMPEVNDAVQDMLNLSDEQFALLPPDFAKKHWDLINDVTNGVEGAIDELRNKAGEEILLNIDAVLNDEQLQADVLALHSQIAEFDQSQFTVGVALDPVAQADFYKACNDIISKAGMTQKQANAYFANMGYNVEFEEKPAGERNLGEIQQYWKPPTYSFKSIPYGVGGSFSVVTMDSPGEWVPKQSTATVAEPPAFAIKTITPNGSYGGGISQGVRSKPSGSSTKPKTSGSKGGGGGGGSSSPPKYNEEKHKNTSDEKERYHVIKNQLEDLTSQYENISNAKDKAFGATRLANLNKEISAQKKLTQANKEYLSEIEKYLAKDKAAVRALGADIDANGTITNYDALIQKAVNDYNAAVDAFNRATTDDEGAKKAFEAAQERYDQFMETISQYEETQDLYKEQMQQILDDIMTEQSLLLERTQLEVELKINVSEDALQYLEYMMDNIENKAYDCAEAFGYLNGMTQEYFKTAEALEGGLRSLFANQGLTDADFQKLIEGDTATYNKLMDMLSSGGAADLSDGLQQSEIDAAYGFTTDDVDTMRDYVSQLIEANQNLQEIRQTVHEQILNVWDEWNEKLDAGIAKIEHLQSITESYQNIIDIVGQKNLGVSNAFMSKMRQQSIDQANDKLEAEKARYESLKKARDDAYAKFEEQKAKGILSPEEIK